jgi:hypothetical protein
VTRHAGGRRTGVISKGKLRQHLHTPSEISTSCFAYILWCRFHRVTSQRLNCELFICFADASLAEESSQAEARLLVVPIAAITSVPVRRSGEVPFTSSLICIPEG